MIRRLLTAGLLPLMLVAAHANELSTAEAEGRNLALQLLDQMPVENSSLKAVLMIRESRSKRREIPVLCRAAVAQTNWQTIYETTPGTNGTADTLVITHNGTNASNYELNGAVVPTAKTAVPFAGSDYWLMDLGLEFFHWPEQRVARKEFRSSRSCIVLESVNPEPAPGAYARVLSWIDKESYGIVHAEAYTTNGRQLKVFDPKEFKKVNGRWQLQEMEIRNIQTGSRTRLEFQLETK